MEPSELTPAIFHVLRAAGRNGRTSPGRAVQGVSRRDRERAATEGAGPGRTKAGAGSVERRAAATGPPRHPACGLLPGIIGLPENYTRKTLRASSRFEAAALAARTSHSPENRRSPGEWQLVDPERVATRPRNSASPEFRRTSSRISVRPGTLGLGSDPHALGRLHSKGKR